MFNNTYKECFIVCKTKEYDGGFVLDLPFTITSQEIIYNSTNHYCLCPQEAGVEVLAHITYFAEDDEIVKSCEGYIADNTTQAGRDAVKAHRLYSPVDCVFLNDDYEDR